VKICSILSPLSTRHPTIPSAFTHHDINQPRDGIGALSCVVESFFYTLTSLVGYSLMFIAMTYNGGLFITILLSTLMCRFFVSLAELKRARPSYLVLEQAEESSPPQLEQEREKAHRPLIALASVDVPQPSQPHAPSSQHTHPAFRSPHPASFVPQPSQPHAPSSQHTHPAFRSPHPASFVPQPSPLAVSVPTNAQRVAEAADLLPSLPKSSQRPIQTPQPLLFLSDCGGADIGC
jgi:hypothetical protein